MNLRFSLSLVLLFSGITARAAIAEHDTRGTIVDKAEEVGFTARDVLQIRSSHGHVYSPGNFTLAEIEENKKSPEIKHVPANAALLGGFLLESADVLISNWHALVDQNLQAREPLSKCIFVNQSLPKATLINFKLDDEEVGWRRAIADGSLRPAAPNFEGSDMVAIKLKAAMPNAVPFSVDPFKFSYRDCPTGVGCQQIVLVSAQQLQMPGKALGREDVVVQTCEIRSFNPGDDKNSPYVWTNCSSTPSASGSIAFMKTHSGEFVRNGKGELLPFEILASSSDSSVDGRPFNAEPGDLMNATKILILDAKFGEEVLEMAKRKSVLGQSTARRLERPPGAK